MKRRPRCAEAAARWLAACALALALGAGAAPAPARTTVELGLAGRTVAVDVHRPAGPARGAAILSHGFTRSRSTLGGHAAAPWSKALPALRADRAFAGASHCDFESPSDWLCHIACGAPDPARQALVRAALIEAMDRWLPHAPR